MNDEQKGPENLLCGFAVIKMFHGSTKIIFVVVDNLLHYALENYLITRAS